MPSDPALPGSGGDTDPTTPPGGAEPAASLRGTEPAGRPGEPAERPSLPALVLGAARDLGRLDTAFDAEMLLSTLLGGVYAGTAPDRGQALAAFALELDDHLAGAGTETAR